MRRRDVEGGRAHGRDDRGDGGEHCNEVGGCSGGGCGEALGWEVRWKCDVGTVGIGVSYISLRTREKHRNNMAETISV
jgi:hypothetical protein